MTQKINRWNQTEKWENACVETRRDEKGRQRRLSTFSIKKKFKVLDLGCGDGLNTSVLSKMGVKDVTGVDISDKLLKLAKKLNPKNKFFLSSAEKLPFKNNIFDVVLVDSVFHHFMSYPKAISEIRRVLKLRGKLCFIEPHKNIIRTIYDKVCEMSFSKYVPFLKERRWSYLGEIKFMKHWLKTEEDFYDELKKQRFKEILKQKDILSIIGIYEKIS